MANRPKSNAKGVAIHDLKQMPFPFRQALTSAEAKHDAGYLAMPGMTEQRVRQLNQNPASGFGAYSPNESSVQCVIKNAGVMMINNRSMCPIELLLYQNFPIRPNLTIPGSGLAIRCHSYADPITDADKESLPKRARCASAGQAGNSMNLAVCGAMLPPPYLFETDRPHTQIPS